MLRTPIVSSSGISLHPSWFTRSTSPASVHDLSPLAISWVTQLPLQYHNAYPDAKCIGPEGISAKVPHVKWAGEYKNNGLAATDELFGFEDEIEVRSGSFCAVESELMQTWLWRRAASLRRAPTRTSVRRSCLQLVILQVLDSQLMRGPAPSARSQRFSTSRAARSSRPTSFSACPHTNRSDLNHVS